MAELPTTPLPSQVSWWLDSNTMTHTSPLNGTVHTLLLPGARWRAALVYNNLLRDELNLLTGFINGLNGNVGRVTLHPLQQQSTSVFWETNSDPYPWVGRQRTTVDLFGDIEIESGATSCKMYFGDNANGTVPFQAGYFFEINGELKQATVTPPAIGSGSEFPGQTTINFAPALRTPITERITARLISPTSAFKLVNDQQGRADYRGSGKVGSVSIELEEVI